MARKSLEDKVKELLAGGMSPDDVAKKGPRYKAIVEKLSSATTPPPTGAAFGRDPVGIAEGGDA